MGDEKKWKTALDIRQEAILRLERAGFSQAAIESCQNGDFVIDKSFHSSILSDQQIVQLCQQAARAVDAIAIGAIPADLNGDEAIICLLVHNVRDDWRFPHEMYQGVYPYCFVANLTHPEKTLEGYLSLSRDKLQVFQFMDA